MSILSQFKQSQNTDFPNVRPSLDLDFTQEKLDPRITYTRGSIGTRVNRNRVIETVAANQPRIDYDPVTGECKGLLIEESRTNLITDSIILSNMNDNANATVTDNSIISPDGTQNASKIQETIVRGSHNISRFNVTTSASTTYTISGYFKKGERNIVSIAFRNVGFWGAVNPFATFNILTGVLVGASGTINSTSITNVGNGWYRCSVTATRDGSGTVTSGTTISIFSNAGNSNYQGESGSGLYAWGLQMEAGAFPTSFIPTFGSTVTRSADLASMTGTNFSSWYNSSEGSLFVAARINALGSLTFPGIAYVDDGTVNNSMGFYVADAGDDKIGAESYISGRAQYILFSSSATTANKLNKAISSYSINNFSAAFDTSSQIQRDTNGSIPTVNRLRLGALRGGLFPLNGTISRLTYYPRALKPNQLQYLTQ